MPPAPRHEFIDHNIAAMRSRAKGAGDPGERPPGRADGESEQRPKRRKHARSLARRAAAVVGTAALVAATVAWHPGRQHQKSDDAVASAADASVGVAALESVDVAPPPEVTKDWSQCAVAPQPAVVVEEKAEPLWLPTYPTSLPTKGYADFLEALTGVPKAAKSYYRSSPSVKRCHHPGSADKVQGITCDVVHRECGGGAARALTLPPLASADSARLLLPAVQRSCLATVRTRRPNRPASAAGSSSRCAIP